MNQNKSNFNESYKLCDNIFLIMQYSTDKTCVCDQVICKHDYDNV